MYNHRNEYKCVPRARGMTHFDRDAVGVVTLTALCTHDHLGFVPSTIAAATLAQVLQQPKQEHSVPAKYKHQTDYKTSHPSHTLSHIKLRTLNS